MRPLLAFLLLAATAFAQNTLPPIPKDDAVRIHEFYRLAAETEDSIWPGWSSIPSPVLLVTPEMEYLTHHPSTPKEFKDVGDGFSVRPRQFQINLLATFPAFGPPSVIVIGEPANTASKTSTPWLITVMHEHFHQLQNSQPGYYEAVQDLGLIHGDNTGMWMLNYPFPYDNEAVSKSFASLRDSLLAAVHEPDDKNFQKAAKRYVEQRKKFFAQLSPDDAKYLNFQLWQEGIARYTQIKAAEAAAQYKPTAEYSKLSDFEPFASYAAKRGLDTLNELRQVDLGKSKRGAVYPFGAAEGLLLDRMKPGWKDNYFKHMLSMDQFFQ